MLLNVSAERHTLYVSSEEALHTPPGRPVAPQAILDSLVLLNVQYIDWQGGVQKEGQIVVADKIADTMGAFFRKAIDIHFPMGPVAPANDTTFRGVDLENSPIQGLNNDDEVMMYNNISSGFNFRKIAGSQTLSRHSEGLAVDINPRLNRYSRYQKTANGIVLASEAPANFIDDPNRPGTFYAGHPLVQFMLRRDMVWGGLWTAEKDLVVDQHHFGYQEWPAT
jgi:hypothetical protein